MHKDEAEVARLLLEKDAKKRQQMLCYIRNRGTHLHNLEVMRKMEGTMIVARRPTQNVNHASYGPCRYCFGYYVQKDLWRHKCPMNEGAKKNHLPNNGRMMIPSRMLLPLPVGGEQLQEVLAGMKPDEITIAAKNDQLILELGQREHMKLGHDKEQHNFIRTKMREAARFLLEARKVPAFESKTLTELITPSAFSDLCAVVRSACGFDQSTKVYAIPSLALKMGHLLKKAAQIVKGKAVEIEDPETERKANGFLHLYETRWASEVSSHALRTLNNSKRNKKAVLPNSQEIAQFSRFLKNAQETQFEKLKAGDIGAYQELQEIVLAKLICFNRRRQGEVSKMTLEDFDQIHFANTHEMEAIHTQVEKNLAKLFKIVEVVGKRGRSVPILLTDDDVQCLQLLKSNRSAAGVDIKNTFVFARVNCGSLHPIRGCDVLRKLAADSGVINPDNIRSTKLRKQLATSAQMVALKEHELEQIASFMGHDIRVHAAYYRMPDEVARVTKLSKLFLAIEQGKLPSQAGANLDSLTFSENEDDTLSSENTDSEHEDDLQGIV
jgi:hypothetical protein